MYSLGLSLAEVARGKEKRAIYCEAAESDACRSLTILKSEFHRVTSHILDSELPSLQPRA